MTPERERTSGLAASGEHRNPFDLDYDRIVCSSSIRRLQDKTQVFPLQENDFTRTRLTHSLETSALGRSLGNRIGRWLAASDPDFEAGQINCLASLLMVAGLVHDLGNPPFGHYGEQVIRAWFASPTHGVESFLSPEQLSDFVFFDGNAQTIRILARLQFLRDRHGINFCFGTLATLMKYPWPSSDERTRPKGKFGYFQSEADLARRVIEAAGLLGRHPATYLLEAADDIAYLFADLEDAVKKGYLPWAEVAADLLADEEIWRPWPESRHSLAEDLRGLALSDVPAEEKPLIGARYFKLLGQGLCLDAVFNEFCSWYQAIMSAAYPRQSLLDGDEIRAFVAKVRDICVRYAYGNREVLSLELIGHSVLTGLLDRFVPAVLDPAGDRPGSDSSRLRRLISRNFDYVQHLDGGRGRASEQDLSAYQRLQLVVDFISGMTDSYALNLHKKLQGLILP